MGTTKNKFQSLMDIERSQTENSHTSENNTPRIPNRKNRNGPKSPQKKQKNKKIKKQINLLYANPMGITGKIDSLITVAKSSNTHIIALAETKLGHTTPAVPGYSWYNKPNKPGSGGVALLVRD